MGVRMGKLGPGDRGEEGLLQGQGPWNPGREGAAGGHQVLGQGGWFSESREDAKKEGAERTFSQLSLHLLTT